MIKPVTDWSSSYKDLFYKDLTVETSANIWGDWVHQNTQGLSAAPPWSGSSVTLNRASFPPVSGPPAPTPVPFCTQLCEAWFSYIASSVWTVPPPIPPFLTIALAGPSMSGIGGAKATLLSTLISTMSVTPPTKETNEALATQIATAFYTATLASGLMLSGMSIPSPTSVPLVLPLLPVM